MTTSLALPTHSNPMVHVRSASDPGRRLGPDSRSTLRWEIAAFGLLLVLLNFPLLVGGFSTDFIFLPAAVRAGEWWRLLTHAFVHLSWYHLALDVAAFVLAYAELRERRTGERVGFVAAAGAGSLAAAWFAAPIVASVGLCGLSGIAHGLTAIVGLELFAKARRTPTSSEAGRAAMSAASLAAESDRWLRWAGLCCFVAVVGKAAIEAITGTVAFAAWHPQAIGIPIAVSHAGGVVGALVAAWCFSPWSRNTRTAPLPDPHRNPANAVRMDNP